MLSELVFGIGAFCAGVVTVALISDIVSGRHRFWPPNESTWTTRVYLLCSRTLFLSLLATGVLDWNRGALLWDPAALAGLCLFVLGMAVTTKAGADLGEDLTKGNVEEVRTTGLYRYSRNPQNVGYVVAFGGLTLLTNSPLEAILAVGATVWLVLMALIEEPWLYDHYGERYATYCSRTPRFVGMRTFGALFGDE